jgi:diguanylate cyclase (GGDEF)-like protein
MTLAYVKIESIEWINHEYGKDFADNIILSVAQILKDTIRKSDLLVRVEMDEFLVIFRQCENRFAKKVIERAKSRTAGLSSQSKFEIKFHAGFADSANDEISSSKQMVESAYQQMKLESELQTYSSQPLLMPVEEENSASEPPPLSSLQSKVS